MTAKDKWMVGILGAMALAYIAQEISLVVQAELQRREHNKFHAAWMQFQKEEAIGRKVDGI